MVKAAPDRIGRLLEMSLLLQEKVYVTASQLAERFDVTERTIYRDMHVLSRSIPISSVPGVKGGYRLAKSFDLDPIIFTDDRSSLFTLSGESLLTMLPGMKEERSMRVIEKSVQNLPRGVRSLAVKARSRIVVDSDDWYWSTPSASHLPLLKKAVMESLECRALMSERGSSKEHTITFQPLGLVWKGGNWYVVFLDKAEKRICRARLSRLRDISETNQTFEYPRDFNLRAWWVQDIEEFGRGRTKVLLKIFPPAFQEFEGFNWKSDSKLQKLESHWIAQLHVNNYEWLIPLVLSFAPHIVVMKPERLRDRILRATKEMLGRYMMSTGTADSTSIVENTDLRRRAALAPHSTDSNTPKNRKTLD